MIKLIESKLKELREIFPGNPEFRTWMQDSDRWSWVYSILRIRGEKVHKTAVVKMIQGNLSDEITLASYALADRFRTVYQDMVAYISMDTELELKMVCRWAKLLLGKDLSEPDGSVFRTNCSVVYEWDLIPEDESLVAEDFGKLIREYNDSFDKEDPLKRAVKLHLGMNRLYPFGDDTTLVSMTVLMFSLLELGYPLPQLPVDDREYNEMMTRFIADGDLKPFKDMLERSVYNRLEAVVSLARQAAES